MTMKSQHDMAPAASAPPAPGTTVPSAQERVGKAKLVIDGSTGNLMTIGRYAAKSFGALDIAACAAELREQVRAVHAGDMREPEKLLVSQALSLNAIYVEMARRAADLAGQNFEAADRYLRLALKAQSQSRATLETLANLKNPPVVIARQANIAHGHQQINNHAGPAPPGLGGAVRTRAGKNKTTRNELLEGADGEGLDSGAARQAGRGDPALEAVGARHRPAKR